MFVHCGHSASISIQLPFTFGPLPNQLRGPGTYLKVPPIRGPLKGPGLSYCQKNCNFWPTTKSPWVALDQAWVNIL